MSNSAIEINHVWKEYERGRIRRKDIRSTVQAGLSDFLRKKETFYALQDINLSIDTGDIVGIIGPNGAGKSTLLKLLSRITYPSRGRMVINGTLSSMLEVGTGFHPELTGRENIYLNGAIIGMRRQEVTKKLDSIVAFSGLEAFLETPVKHYSSGMYVRLAFAVASHLEPDILLIDEVLAVGDQEFRKKCLNKILDVSGQGRTIVMVSHQMSYLKLLCKRGVYLNSGKLIHEGEIDEVINTYVNDVNKLNPVQLQERTDRKGNGKVKVANLTLLDREGENIPVISAGQEIILRMELVPMEEVRNVEVRIDFYDTYGHLWFISKNSISGNMIEQLKDRTFFNCHFPKFPLNKNFYYLNVAVYVQNEISDEVVNAVTLEVEQGSFYTTGKLPPSHKGMLVDYYWSIRENV